MKLIPRQPGNSSREEGYIPTKFLKPGNIFLAYYKQIGTSVKYFKYFFKVVRVNFELGKFSYIKYDPEEPYHEDTKDLERFCTFHYFNDETIYLCTEAELAAYLLTKDTPYPVFPNRDETN